MIGLFSDEMAKLNLEFVEMGVNVSEQIYRATKSYIEHDKKLAQQVINGDEKINEEETELENRALQIMALKQPLAKEFRLIISALKASSDLERIGDHAATIARETIEVKGNERVPEIEELLGEMTNKVRSMMETVLDAYSKDNADTAKEAAKMDLEVDVLYYKAHKLIVGVMERQTDTAVANASYLNVARLLERIGDHIVNLAEWVVYQQSAKLVELNPGKIDRHIVQKEVDGLIDEKEALKKVGQKLGKKLDEN